MLNPYTKAFLLACMALLTALVTAVEDGSGLTTSEITVAVIAFVGGLGTVWAANLSVKWIVGGLVAAAAAFAEAIQDGGLSTQEYLLIAGAALTSLVSVYSTSNSPASSAPAVAINETPVVEVAVQPTRR